MGDHGPPSTAPPPDTDAVPRRDAFVAASGRRQHAVAALDETTGSAVAATTVWLWPGHPVGRQRDTAVLREHRGRGLGLLVKSAMALRLARLEPALTTLQTWNDVHNTPMLAVNERLGWRTPRAWTTYEGSLSSLVAT